VHTRLRVPRVPALLLAALSAFALTAAATGTATELLVEIVGAAPAPAERRFDGIVEAVEHATLTAQTAGRVERVERDVGMRADAGDLLVRIRAAEQVAGRAGAEAALRQAVARAAEAQSQYARVKDMYERRVVARATYDSALAARDSTNAQVEAARAGLAAASEGEAYTMVRAPFAGVVTRRHAEPGEAVAPGTPLLEFAALGAQRVLVDLPPESAAQLRARGAASILYDGRRIASSSVTVYPAADAATGTVRARVNLPADTGGLAPGQHVKVAIALGERGRLTVAQSALVERSELRAVYVVDEQGRVSLRQLRVGRREGDRVEVLAGLVAGERVALDPVAAARQVQRAADGTTR
jgi:RND family efflux transporter MFP subunit